MSWGSVSDSLLYDPFLIFGLLPAIPSRAHHLLGWAAAAWCLCLRGLLVAFAYTTYLSELVLCGRVSCFVGAWRWDLARMNFGGAVADGAGPRFGL